MITFDMAYRTVGSAESWLALSRDGRIDAAQVAGAVPIRKVRNLLCTALRAENLAPLIAAADAAVESGDVESFARVLEALAEGTFQIRNVINDSFLVPKQLERSEFVGRVQAVLAGRWSAAATGAADLLSWLNAGEVEAIEFDAFDGSLDDLVAITAAVDFWETEMASGDWQRQLVVASEIGAVRISQIEMLQQLLVQDKDAVVRDRAVATLLESQDVDNCALVCSFDTDWVLNAVKSVVGSVDLVPLLERVIAECSGHAIGGARELIVEVRRLHS